MFPLNNNNELTSNLPSAVHISRPPKNRDDFFVFSYDPANSSQLISDRSDSDDCFQQQQRPVCSTAALSLDRSSTKIRFNSPKNVNKQLSIGRKQELQLHIIVKQRYPLMNLSTYSIVRLIRVLLQSL